jgi:hypothetical protein
MCLRSSDNLVAYYALIVQLGSVKTKLIKNKY